MSSIKRGGGADSFYNTHLFGYDGRFNTNPSANRERAIATMLERNISELAVNRFKWEGLPESIDPRFLEMCLLLNGLAVWYWDDDYDKLLAVRGSGVGTVNMLDNPVSFTVIGPGSTMQPDNELAPALFKNKTLGAYQPAVKYEDDEVKRKAIGMWPNYFRYPEIDVIRIYSTRLATIDRTLEINTKNARRNKVLRTTPNTQLSIVNMNRQIDEGVEAIQVSDSFADMNVIDAIDLGILPDSYDKLGVHRTRVWNECMNLLGIDNANQEKKERLVAAEVGANDSQTDSMRYVSLNARRYAADQINKVFGTKIKVDFNVEVEQQAEAMEQNTNPAGGEENGNVHAGAENSN
jgi:hypothetical protein